MSVLQCSKIEEVFPLFLRGSTLIDCSKKSVKLHLVTLSDMPLGWAVVFCDEINPDLMRTKLCLKHTTRDVDITRDVFSPAKCGINTSADAHARLRPLANLCKECDIDCIFINGHFNQHDADRTGRGHILCGKSGNDLIYTMNVFHAVRDPFIKDQLGIIEK